MPNDITRYAFRSTAQHCRLAHACKPKPLRHACANVNTGPDNRRGIKPNLVDARQRAWAGSHERSSRATQALHFCWGDRLERVAKVGAAPGLDFTHHEHTITPSNDVEFATWAAPVAGDDRVARAHVPRSNEIFGKPRPRLIR